MTTHLGFQGQRLRALRHRLGLSAAEVARQVNLSENHIYRLERSEIPQVRGLTVAQLATVLHTTMDYLFNLTADPRVPISPPPQPTAHPQPELPGVQPPKEDVTT
jgi:transcriptional regulator with XRE-family HTH domain